MALLSSAALVVPVRELSSYKDASVDLVMALLIQGLSSAWKDPDCGTGDSCFASRVHPDCDAEDSCFASRAHPGHDDYSYFV